MNNNFYLDIHVIQTVPPCCVNRDDTGSPKTALYGGVTRSRVSSQAWKRAIRQEFKDIFASDMIGYRTKNIKSLLVKAIIDKEPSYTDEEAGKLAEIALEKAKIKSSGDKKDVLFFISSQQVDALADTVISYSKEEIKETEKDKKYKSEWERCIKENPSIDMLLFGRMSANSANLNFEACAQVAHSISTHKVTNEYDYFTAVDDNSEEDNAGAGHLGTVEFNSSTLYRYGTVNISQLLDSELSEENVAIAVKGFVDAFIKSMPTGKMNTFANRTLPCFVYIAVRNDQPVNLAGAFEKPVRTSEGGYEEKSIDQLEIYANKIYDAYSGMPSKSWIVSIDKESFCAAEKVKITELLELVETEVMAFSNERM